MGNTASSSTDVSAMNSTTFIPSNISSSDLPPTLSNQTTITSLSNAEYSKQDFENISIVKSKLLHYLQEKGQENQIPDHVLNFIIEPLSIESELKGSYLTPDWKTTSRMVEIYEFMCFKYVHNSHHCKQDEDYQKLLSEMKNTLNSSSSSIGNIFMNNTSAFPSSSSDNNSNNTTIDSLPPLLLDNNDGNVVSGGSGSGSGSGGDGSVRDQESVVSTNIVNASSFVGSKMNGDNLLKRRSQSFSGISQINLNEIQNDLQSEKSSEIKKTPASSSFTEQSRKVSSPKSPKDENDEKNDSTTSRLKRTLSNLKKVPKLKLPELSKSPKTSRANSVSSPKDLTCALSITSSQSTSNLETMDKRASMRSILIDTKSFNQHLQYTSHQDNDSHQTTTSNEQDKSNSSSSSGSGTNKIGLLKKLGSFKKTKNTSLQVGISGDSFNSSSASNASTNDKVSTSKNTPNDHHDDNDRILSNTEHDQDDKFKALKSQYIEERKQKREYYHTHHLYFNDHEFMEHENMEHAKAIDDLMSKRAFSSSRELSQKNEIDMKRLFSKNDELPFYIKEKLGIIAHQRPLTNQLIGIKLMIFDCSCKHSIIRLLSPVRETLEFSKSKGDVYSLGLLIGPWILTYHEDIGLVIPSKIIPPLENILFDLGTLDLSSSLDQICAELTSTIIEWNTKRYYSKKKSDPMPDYLKEVNLKGTMTPGSSYDFVMEVLSNLGVRLNISDNPSLQLLFSNTNSHGSSPMVWITENNEQIIFETHSQLDEYVNHLSKSSNNSIALYRSLDWELLKSYDRIFWAKHLTTINQKFDPSFNHETTINCPFKHPYLI